MAISISEVDETLKKVIEKFTDTDDKPTNQQPVEEIKLTVKSNIEVYHTLKQVIELLSDTDRLTNQLLEAKRAKDPAEVESFENDIEETVSTEGELRDEFYELMLPFYDGDNLFQLSLHQLGQEIYKVIRTEEHYMVGLLEGLQTVRVNIFSLCEKAIPLMRQMNVEVGLGVEMRLRNIMTHFQAGNSSVGVKRNETGEQIMGPPLPFVKPPPAPPKKLRPIAATPISIVKPPPVPEKLLPVKKRHKVEIKRNEHGGVLIFRPLQKPIPRTPVPEKPGPSSSTAGVKRNETGDGILRPPPKRGRLGSLDNASDVAVQMYGFPENIGRDIQESMEYRKLIMNEREFDEDEAAIMQLLDFDDDDQEKIHPDGTDIWVRVRMLKLRFKELKKKIFGKKKDDEPPPRMLGDSIAAARGTPAEVVKVNRPGPEIVRATFRRVLRNWIFHIEDMLFNFIIYELYYMLAQNDRAEAIFQQFWIWLTELRESNQRNVPITVHKSIYMMENPTGLKLDEELVLRSPTVTGIGWENLDRTLGLETIMEQIQGIILRLMGILRTACLSTVDRLIPVGEAAMHEETLEQIEEEMREIERKINWVKLHRD